MSSYLVARPSGCIPLDGRTGELSTGTLPVVTKRAVELFETPDPSKPAADRYRTYFDNTKRLKELIKELEELSAHAVEEAEGWSPK